MTLFISIGPIFKHQMDNPQYFVLSGSSHELPHTSSLANIADVVIIDILTDEGCNLRGARLRSFKETVTDINEFLAGVRWQMNMEGKT